MSYDELMISAMSGISCNTQFINAGSRNNCGRDAAANSFIKSGIYMGLIGARFEKSGFMEHSLMCINSTYTSTAGGYGIVRGSNSNRNKNKNNNENKANSSHYMSSHSNQTIAPKTGSKPNMMEIYDDSDEDENEDGNETQDNNNNNNNDTEAKDEADTNINIDTNTNTAAATIETNVDNNENDTEMKSNDNSNITNNNNNDNEEKDETKNEKSDNVSIGEEFALQRVENESKELSEFDIKEKFIDLFCHWYGNVKSIPTYNELATLFEESEKSMELKNYLAKRFVSSDTYWGGKTYFDIFMFKIRMRISLELFLFDSDYRTKSDANKELAYCHLVGLGLGVWTLQGFKTHETQVFVQCVKDIINETNLPNIGAIDFSWFDRIAPFADKFGKKSVFESDSNGEYYCFDASKKHKIDVNFSKRSPAALLAGKYANYKLCAMYAWDGNAQPGNEYYMGSLAASGDPAAACCSTIPYIQNSMINVEYINGANTVVYFRDLENKCDYKRMKLQEINDNMKQEDWIKLAQNSRPYYNELPEIDLEPYLYD